MSGMILVKVYMAVVFFVQKLSFIVWIAVICKWELDGKQSLSTTSIMDCQLFCQKVRKSQ